jgi:hypothetical protein
MGREEKATKGLLCRKSHVIARFTVFALRWLIVGGDT